MSFLVRPVRDADYPVIVEIHNNQNEPDQHTTAERMQRNDQYFAGSAKEYLRVVAQKGQSVIGTASLTSHWAGFYRPHRYWTLLSVREEFRNQGVHEAMINFLLESVSASQPEELWTCIRTDFVPIASFIKSFNFSEVFRSWGAHLDVQRFEISKFTPLIERLEREGIHIASYASLSDSKREEKLFTLHKLIEDDVPHYEPIIPKTFNDIRSPHIPEESTFVALDGDLIVGMASLDTEEARLLQNGLTGVRREYRNRGIATALKAHVAHYAKQQGHLDINAAGAGDNIAMLKVNRRLGFHIEPPWITFRTQL